MNNLKKKKVILWEDTIQILSRHLNKSENLCVTKCEKVSDFGVWEKNRESVMCENVCVREKVKVREWKRPCESERVKVSVLKCELGWILKRLREREGVGCVLVRGWKVMSVGKWGGCETRCGQTVHVSQSQVKRNICLNK